MSSATSAWLRSWSLAIVLIASMVSLGGATGLSSVSTRSRAAPSLLKRSAGTPITIRRVWSAQSGGSCGGVWARPSRALGSRQVSALAREAAAFHAKGPRRLRDRLRRNATTRSVSGARHVAAASTG